MNKKTVLITGGNKGIGLASTQRFIEAGFEVIVLARDFADFSLSDHPGIETLRYDLTNIDGIADLVATLRPIDILINNAGVMYSLPYDNYPQDKISSMMQINLEAPVALIQAVAKSMIAKGEGRIVNNTSIAGQIGHPDIWYGITKAGLINITKSFAKILGSQGIVVNAVAPGPVETDMLEIIPELRKQAIKKAVYTGRFAYPEEIAATIFWLATESPPYLNGSCIDLNNGAFPR